MELTNEQKQSLLRYQEKLNEAQSDLADSMETEYMSDTKSAVFALKQEENFKGLPDEVKEELKKLSTVAWRSVTGMENVYRRVVDTGLNVAEIETYVDGLLAGVCEK